jgi:hypothetical protein
VTELHKCGHFINSPLNITPILNVKLKDIDNNLKDKSYQSLRHSNALDDEASECIYTSDREEVISETKFGCKLVHEIFLN